VSASNDHTTRFWSRERPGDASSVFAGGGEKPPEVPEVSGQEEDEEMVVPGFSYAPGSGPPWWGKEEDLTGPGGAGALGEGGYMRRGDVGGSEEVVPGFGAVDAGAVGAGASAGAGRQSGPLPSQEDVFGTGAGGREEWGGRGGEEWARGGGSGGGRQSRWGPRRTRF
jgi:polyadenylation factor subunit 2